MKRLALAVSLTVACFAAGAASAQEPAARIPQIGGNPAPAPLLFREEWNSLPMAQPITAEHLSNTGLTLNLYGDVAGIRKSQHPTENYTYTGETLTNWGLTLSDPEAYWDLSRNGRVMLKTRNSGWRLTHIMIRTAEGSWYVSEEGNPESTYWIEREYILSNLRWRNLMMEDRPTNASNQREPVTTRQPLIPTSAATPDLTRVVEVGFTDLMPGGWIPASTRVNAWAVYGLRVPRS